MGQHYEGFFGGRKNFSVLDVIAGYDVWAVGVTRGLDWLSSTPKLQAYLRRLMRRKEKTLKKTFSNFVAEQDYKEPEPPASQLKTPGDVVSQSE